MKVLTHKTISILLATLTILLLVSCKKNIESSTLENQINEEIAPSETMTTPLGTTTETEITSLEVEKTELTQILDEIEENVYPGTAGCTLSSVPFAVKLLDWGESTTLTTDEIKAETINWLSDKGNDEQVEIAHKLCLVDGICDQLLEDNAKDLLDCAGCDTTKSTWAESPKDVINVIMETVGIDNINTP